MKQIAKNWLSCFQQLRPTKLNYYKEKGVWVPYIKHPESGTLGHWDLLDPTVWINADKESLWEKIKRARSATKSLVVYYILEWLGLNAQVKHIEAKIIELDKDILATINKQLDFQDQLAEEVRNAMRAVYRGDDPIVLELTAKKEKAN